MVKKLKEQSVACMAHRHDPQKFNFSAECFC